MKKRNRGRKRRHCIPDLERSRLSTKFLFVLARFTVFDKMITDGQTDGLKFRQTYGPTDQWTNPER